MLIKRSAPFRRSLISTPRHHPRIPGNQSQHECRHILRNPTVTNSTDRRISSQVATIELFLPHMYVFPCVSCTGLKLALAHTFTFARCILHDLGLVHTRSPRLDLNYLSFAHTFMFSGVGDVYDLRDVDCVLFSGVICMICGIWIMFSGWDMYDLALTHMFSVAGSV